MVVWWYCSTHSEVLSVIIIIFYDNYSLPEIEIGFNFSKSGHIAVNETATYKCSVTHSGMAVSWYINDLPSTHMTIKQLGIITIGAATKLSEIMIPGSQKLNGTNVTCLASGYVNGTYTSQKEVDMLYMQGT